jgi:phosphoribosylpyrophosphate synthetase
LITTKSIPIPPKDLKTLKDNMKVEIMDISSLLGEVIRRAHLGKSVGAMFDE